jgi:hypothetical protein
VHVSTKNKDNSTVQRLSPGMRIAGLHPTAPNYMISKLSADRRNVFYYTFDNILSACEAADVNDRNTRNPGSLQGRGPYTEFVWYVFRDKQQLGLRLLCVDFDAYHALTASSFRLYHLLSMSKLRDGSLRPPEPFSAITQFHLALDNLAVTFGLLFHVAFRDALQTLAQFVRNHDVGRNSPAPFIEFALLTALHLFAMAARSTAPFPVSLPAAYHSGLPGELTPALEWPLTPEAWADVLCRFLRLCFALLTPYHYLSVAQSLHTSLLPLGQPAAPATPAAPAPRRPVPPASPAPTNPTGHVQADAPTPRTAQRPASPRPGPPRLCMADLRRTYNIPLANGDPALGCKSTACRFTHYSDATGYPLADVIASIKAVLTSRLDAAGLAKMIKRASADSKFTTPSS